MLDIFQYLCKNIEIVNEPFKLKSYDYISLRQDQSWFKYS